VADIERRRFLAAAGALLTAPLARADHASKVWRLGVLRPGPDDAAFRENIAPFWPALRNAGFVEGKNLQITYRVRPAKQEEMLILANELVRAKVDAILAISPLGVSAAAKATKSIPIVAVDLGSDPLIEKFAESLARPGRNVTGLFLDFPEMGGKWIQLLRDAVPNLTRVGVLWDPSIGAALLRGAEAAAAAMRVRVERLEARTPANLPSAFEAAATRKLEALLVLSTPVFASALNEIANRALKGHLPTIMLFPGFADAGGLMAYGPHLTSMFSQAAGCMAKVLRGAPPGEIAIERPSRFEMVINMKTAKALHLTIPQAILLHADRVIE